MSLLMNVAVRGERLVYRICGLPVALSAHSGRSRRASETIRRAYKRAYWRPATWGGYVEIVAAWLLWPIFLLGGAAWFTARNGREIRRRHGRGLAAQFADQVRLYFTNGIGSPWYYIFELAKQPTQEHAEAYAQRSETKAGIYILLRRGVKSQLNDKKIFADQCAEAGVPCVPYLFQLDGSDTTGLQLPDTDLFVKPANGRGGRGAERWDNVAPGLFSNSAGEQLDAGELLKRLNARASDRPLLVQRRLNRHPDIADLTSGALPTIRITTVRNEDGEPEAVSAVFRTAIGANRTVDNLHAGGIAAGVDLGSGVLSKASNLGMDSRLGWLTHHPDTGAQIEGRKLPFWDLTKALAVDAHRSLGDRVLVGWDIGLTEDGPLVVEGNSAPDLDIVQRFGQPVCSSRFGELLAFHLRERGFAG